MCIEVSRCKRGASWGRLLLAKGTYRLLAQPKGRAYSSYFVAGAKDLRGRGNGSTGYGQGHKTMGCFMPLKKRFEKIVLKVQRQYQLQVKTYASIYYLLLCICQYS